MSKKTTQLKSDEDWIEIYFNILSNYAKQASWIIIIITLTTIIGFFTFYNSEFSSFEFAEERETGLLANVKFDIDSLNNTLDTLNNTATKEITFLKLDSLRTDSMKYEKNLVYIESLIKETKVIEIPLIGEKVGIPEYVLFFYLICSVSIFWLLTLLEFIKNVLKEIFNYPSSKNDNYSISIPSLFYLLLPSNDNLKFYKYFELILLIFLLSIILIPSKIAYEIFFNHDLHDKALLSLDTYPKDQIFWTIGIYLILIGAIMFFYVSIAKRIQDIRNLLILIKWQRVAFFPELYNLFQEKNLYLKRKQNRMEYRRVGISKNHKLCIYANVYNPNYSEDIRFIRGKVNLAESLKKFLSYHRDEQIERTFKVDKHLDRILTIEEDKMRLFFRQILNDENYENEMAISFKEVIKQPIISNERNIIHTKTIDLKKLDLAKNKLESSDIIESILIIEEIITDHFPSRKNELTALKFRFDSLNKNWRKGIIPFETFGIEERNIVNSLIEIIEVMKRSAQNNA